MYGYSFHQDGSIKGDKKYLSYSAIELWRKDKDLYRRRYYEGEPAFTSPFTVFGTEVHKQAETGELTIDGHPAHEYMHEVKVEANIDGVHMLGYVDLFHKEHNRVVDIKTSINAWCAHDVERLDQLPCYVLLLRENGVKVSQHAGVLWLETIWMDCEMMPKDIAGFCVQDEISHKRLALTGKQVYLPRCVHQTDIDRVRDNIIRVGQEIREDFNVWKKKN